jgi:hypothetical protein
MGARLKSPLADKTIHGPEPIGTRLANNAALVGATPLLSEVMPRNPS